MKKLFILLIVLVVFSNVSFAQFFKLTPDGIVNSTDSTKNYVVLDFPDKNQKELFDKAKIYIVGNYNSSKSVLSEASPDVLSVLANTDFTFKYIMNYSAWLKYKYTLTFKDEKIKVEFNIVDMGFNVPNPKSTIGLIRNRSNNIEGIYDKKGEVSSQVSIDDIERYANYLTVSLNNAITGDSKKDDW
jgi:hypothetical protein